VISNWTGRPVFFCTIVARRRTVGPEQMSSNRSLTKSHARSLLSIARLKIARSRLDFAISKRTRMDQTCFGSRGFFWPMSKPLFHGRWHRTTGCTGIRRPPPSHPPRRSIASERLIAAERPSFPHEILDGPLLAQSGRSYANGISWSITNEEKTIQFPTGKEIAKTLSAQARAGRSPRGVCGILDME